MMTDRWHRAMRTTLTLDDDLAAKLRAEARRSGKPFREIVNDAIRRRLMNRRSPSPAGAFRRYRP
jgi:Arc/MetJ family transcription regulator